LSIISNDLSHRLVHNTRILHNSWLPLLCSWFPCSHWQSLSTFFNHLVKERIAIVGDWLPWSLILSQIWCWLLILNWRN
jgi:hypothetical protein